MILFCFIWPTKKLKKLELVEKIAFASSIMPIAYQNIIRQLFRQYFLTVDLNDSIV